MITQESTNSHVQRVQNTVNQLRNMRHVFDRITEDGKGGRVSFFHRKPRGYDSKAGLPWDRVRGRYWYPWS